MNRNIFDAARELKALGYDVIPVGASDRAGVFNPKNPGIVADWRSHAWDADALCACLREDDRRGIGLRLSPATYIDIESDTKEADDAATDVFGTIETPSWWGAGANGHYAGKHRLFRLSDAQRQWLIDNQHEGGFKTKAGIEVRCTGQSVVPPSGDRKWWYRPDWAIATIPDHVWAKLTEGQERKQREHADAQADTPGADFCIRGDWREILEPHGWTFINDEEVVRPGKDKDAGLSATIGRCGEGGARGDLLFIFSDDPSIEPLEPKVTYSKFEAYTFLNHGGNFSAAAKALRKDGYGYSGNAESMFEEHDIEWDVGPEVVEDAEALFEEWGESASTSQEVAVIRTKDTTEHKADAGFPVLDDKHYNNVIGEYVREIAQYSNIDYQAVYFQALEMFGAMVGRAAWYTYNMGTRYLTDYLIVAGLTGAGKGVTFDAAKTLFKPPQGPDPFSDAPDHEKAYYAINRGRFGSAEGLIDELGGRKPDTDVDGFTLGEQYWGVLFLSDQEASAGFAKMFIDNSVVNETYRQAWDFNTLSNTTKTKKLLAKSPVIGFVWHIVPDDLSRLPAGLLHGGFINRLKIVHCSKPAKTPRILPGVDVPKHKAALGAVLAKIAETPGEITFDAAAQERLDEIAEWQHNLEGNVATAHERFTAHVERMACRMALLDSGRRVVNLADVETAEAIQRVIFSHTELLIGELRGGDEKKIFEQILFEYIRDAAEPVSLSEINRYICQNQSIKLARRDAALDRLVAAGLVEKGTVKRKKGRPTVIYRAK